MLAFVDRSLLVKNSVIFSVWVLLIIAFSVEFIQCCCNSEVELKLFLQNKRKKKKKRKQPIREKPIVLCYVAFNLAQNVKPVALNTLK